MWLANQEPLYLLRDRILGKLLLVAIAHGEAGDLDDGGCWVEICYCKFLASSIPRALSVFEESITGSPISMHLASTLSVLSSFLRMVAGVSTVNLTEQVPPVGLLT